jgi:hypothetical protein
MRRKLLSWLPRVAAVLTIVVLSACGGSSGEQQVLKKYFDASRLRDNRTTANIATVSFRPSEEGSVQSFSIETVGEEMRTPLGIKELSNAYEQAKAAEEEFSKNKKTYQDENLEAIDRVLRAERENTSLRGRDLEVQTAWTKWREEMAVSAKTVSDAQQALGAARSVAELSVFDASNPVDVTQYDGDMISKEITINARIKTPDDQNVEKALKVTIQRAVLRGGPAGEISGRWVITSIQQM